MVVGHPRASLHSVTYGIWRESLAGLALLVARHTLMALSAASSWIPMLTWATAGTPTSLICFCFLAWDG
jgi:hypothetical protein